jgi:hypothetical protein
MLALVSATTAVPGAAAPSEPAAGEPQAAVAAGNGVSAFATGTDGRLWWRQLTSNGWWAWQPFNGAIIGKVAAVSASSGVYVFGRGLDNALYWQRYTNSSWSGWQSFGGAVSADPAVVTNGTEIDVFVRGGDGGLYSRRFDGTSWSDWRSGGGFLTSAPAAATDGTSFHVFTRGGDGALYWQRFDTGVGAGWASLGGGIQGAPSAAADSSGVSVFVRGLDSALYSRHLGATWSVYQNWGGGMLSSPSALGVGDAIDVFVQGLDSGAYYRQITSSGSTDWASLGGLVTAPMSATIDASGITLFARGGDSQLYAKTYANGWSDWGQAGGVPIGFGPVALASPEITVPPPAPPAGRGFDTCETPSTSAMSTWRNFSSFTSVGIYIGGINRACSNNALNSATWVNTVVAQGWRLIPIYVGLQAPCTDPGNGAQLSLDLVTAAGQGRDAANDAVFRAGVAGIGPGAPIYYDMEGYNSTDAGCVGAVRLFISGWVAQLHALGYTAGMYSSLCSGIADQATVYDNSFYNRLDAIWVAAWAYNDQNDPGYSTYQPNLFGYTGCGASVTDVMWPFHQRLRQFRGGHNETYGGVTINIDTDAVDGPLG